MSGPGEGRRKVLLVCSSLQAGGAERVLAELANAWAAGGNSITLLSIYAREAGADFYALDPRVSRVRINERLKNRRSAGRLARLKAMRRVVAEVAPEVIVAFVDKVAIATIIATLGLGIPVVACERTDPERHKIGFFWSLLRLLCYPLAAAVTVQTQGVSKTFKRRIPAMNLHVVPNPIPRLLVDQKITRSDEEAPRKRLVTVAGLRPEKGVDLLIEAFSRVSARFPDWDLWIWGDGSERARLVARIQSLNLEGRIFMPGRTDKPWEEMAKAEIFVLPSRYEGMPNSMMEAMALGRPVIAFDCAPGPRELSRDGRDAILVPAGSIEALAEAMERLIRDKPARDRLGEAAISIRERYALSQVLAAWNQVLDRAVAACGNSSTGAM